MSRYFKNVCFRILTLAQEFIAAAGLVIFVRIKLILSSKLGWIMPFNSLYFTYGGRTLKPFVSLCRILCRVE